MKQMVYFIFTIFLKLFSNVLVEDIFVEDFLMTYIVFLPVVKLCPMLISYYKILDDNKNLNVESCQNNKRKVVGFIKKWCDIAKDAFYEDYIITQFLQVLF